MAKAASPIRLQQALMDDATVAGSVQHRSAAEQVEYWASLGHKIANIVDPAVLLAVDAGLVKITIEKVDTPPVNPDEVFASLGRDRASGALSAAISERSPIRYQASNTYPGQLEQINSDGQVTVGQFVNGRFQARKGE